MSKFVRETVKIGDKLVTLETGRIAKQAHGSVLVTCGETIVLVTVCGKGGGRSERAATELRALGWNSVRSLCGGTQAWLQLAAQGT